MACDDDTVGINHDRLAETKFLDGSCDGSDGLIIDAGIIGVRAVS